MKFYKKLLALGLSVAMLAGMTACGGGDDTTSDTDTPVQNSDSDTSTNDTTPAPADNDGNTQASSGSGETRTIRIGTWWDQYYNSGDADIYADPSISDEEVAQMRFNKLKEVEEKYNVRIEWVNLTWDGIQESINTSILAGQPDCDIYQVDLSFGIPAALNGYAVNLAETLPADADLLGEQIGFKPVEIGLTDGSVYLFGEVSGESKYYNTYMMAYNKQLLDDAGLEAPEDLYERGEWTWDKWREYMIALTQDTDGDGVIDQYGYGSRFDFLIYNMTMSNGTTIASTPTENLSSPEVGECLDFIYNMYNVDHVAVPWNADNFDANQNNYLNGNVAFWITAAWISDANQDATCDFDIVWCPWPIGPSGNADTNGFRNASSGNAFFIPVGVEDPAFVYQVYEEYRNWYNWDTSIRDADLTWWEDCAMTEENLEVMAMTGSRDVFDIWNALGVDYQFEALITGEVTPAQYQEMHKQEFQDALDGFFN